MCAVFAQLCWCCSLLQRPADARRNCDLAICKPKLARHSCCGGTLQCRRLWSLTPITSTSPNYWSRTFSLGLSTFSSALALRFRQSLPRGTSRRKSTPIFRPARPKRRRERAAFIENCKILLFDFNNEFTRDNCLTIHKRVYDLTTRNDNGARIPLGAGGLTDIEIVSILADATDKTQKPFLKRALVKQDRAMAANSPTSYVRGILQRQLSRSW